MRAAREIFCLVLIQALASDACFREPSPPQPPPPSATSGVCKSCSGSRRSDGIMRNGNFTKIVGGTNAGWGDAPWQVALTSRASSNIYSAQFCGGTLINSDWVLTAAHCTQGRSASSMYCYVGVLDLRSPGNYYSQVSRKIEHPSYRNVNYDFALLQMKNGFNLPAIPNVAPACLPSGSTPANVNVLISGWGSLSSGGSHPNVLQKATVTTYATSVCQAAYGGRWTTPSNCASVNGQKDTCQGDSGGPLVYENGGRAEVYGVTSWGDGCALAGKPGVYADVPSVKSWITSNTGGEC